MVERIFIDSNAFFKRKEKFMEIISKGHPLVINNIVVYEVIKVLDELISESNDKKAKLYKMLKERFPKLLKDLDVEIKCTNLDNERLLMCYEIMKNKNVDIGDAIIYLFMVDNKIQKILSYDDDWRKFDIEIIRRKDIMLRPLKILRNSSKSLELSVII